MFAQIVMFEVLKNAGRYLIVKAIKSDERTKALQEKLGFDSIDDFMKAGPEQLNRIKQELES